MFQLKDLLPDALRRGRISHEVAAVKIIEAFNDLVAEQLPPDRRRDVFAVGFKDGIIEAGCKNNMAAHWIIMREQDLLAALSRRVTEVGAKKIKTKIKYDI